MLLSELIQFCPPPSKPLIYCTPEKEREVSAEVGLTFPRDYIEFCKIYGSGAFESPNTHQFGIADVFAPYREMRRRAARVGIRMLRTNPIFEPRLRASSVDKNCLYPLGFDADRRDLIWVTHPDPMKWRVLLLPYDEDLFEVFDCGVTDFLAGFFSGQLFVQGWQTRLERGKPQKDTFTPDPW
jgi:hypothetical protein